MADELKPAYLLAGSDRPKVDRALQRLRSRFAPDAVELHTAAEATGEDIVAAANALGLFAGDGRLIVVDGVEAWKADDAKAIAAYLKAPAPATTLALVADELKKDAPLAKAVAPTGEVLIWEVAKKAVQTWVSEQFKLHGAKAEPEACRALIVLVGDDLYELAAEIDKLTTWAAGEPITATIVEELVAPRAEGSNFALTDAWGARDVAGMLLATEQLLERTPGPALAHDPARREHPDEPRRAPPPVPGPRGRGPLGEGRRGPSQAAPVLRPEALRPGPQLHPGRAARRDGASRRARPRPQGRLAPDGRARAGATLIAFAQPR